MTKNRWTKSLRIGLALISVLSSAVLFAADGRNAASNTGRTVLVLGDSLAAGFGLEPTEAFPAVLQRKIQNEGWDFSVLNGGLSGDTSAGGLRRIDWLLKRQVDVLILELGANDGLRGLSTTETKSNLQRIIDRTKKKYPGVHIVIAGMRMPPNLGADYTSKFEKIFPALAEENRALLIPFLLEGVGGRAELNREDQIHPTAEGHKIVAENVWRILEPLLEKLTAAQATK